MKKEEQLKELRTIPGVGKSICIDLWDLGIRKVDDLRGKDPEQMFMQSNALAGMVQDRCLLYVFRCAVYFAETEEAFREKEKLCWWNWK
jgi:hypothetical protein